MSLSDLCDADLISQPWGCTAYAAEWVRPECVGRHFHAGVDLGYSDGGDLHLGSPIRSPRDGVVVAVGLPYLGPFAPVIRTDAEGVFVELGHVQAVHVAVGDRVLAGQHVADLGSLGASSAGHLHLEVRSDGPRQGPPWTAVLNPMSWLRYLPALSAAALQEVPEMQLITAQRDPRDGPDPHAAPGSAGLAVYICEAFQGPGGWVPTRRRWIVDPSDEGPYVAALGPPVTLPGFLLDRAEEGPRIHSGEYPTEP